MDTFTLQFKIDPLKKEILFEDFSNGIINYIRKKWKCKKISKVKYMEKIKLYGKCCSLSCKKYFHNKYEFVGGISGYSIYYCHYTYRDDYLFVTLQHSVIENKNQEDIMCNTLILLESIGVDTGLLILDDKLNRIDIKRDYEASGSLEIKAYMNIWSKVRDSFNGVEKIPYPTAIVYRPKTSSVEVIVYDKGAEMKARRKKQSHIALDIYNYENVIRTEVRLKSKRLYYDSKKKGHISKKLSSYSESIEKIVDESFRKYVEPIFYTEPFYRIDYALLAIKCNKRLTELEAEKLCYLVSEINKKGFTESKNTYKYSDDTFEKHIKLLRTIGINPITFDENIGNIGIIPNFTTKEVCRDYPNKEQYILDEIGGIE